MNENERSKSAPVIVLIEDDPNVSRMLTRHMEREGWNVRAAGSIAAADELFRSHDWDVALLDRGLPDGDGLVLSARMRAEAPHAYIMMLTGESSEEAKLEGFNRGADDYVTKPFQMPELLARIRAGVRIVGLQKALLESNRQLAELSLTDSLTQLRNRRAFDEELVDRFETARRYDRPLSIAVVDVDRFKSVNDRFGHPAGDAVLRGVAQLLDGSTRQADFVARYGGEEFAIILPETPLFEAMQFGEKIRSAVAAATIRTGEAAHQVTISVGIASMPHSSFGTTAELVAAADQALYRAKQNGRNRVEIEKRMRPRLATLALPPAPLASCQS